MNLYIVLSLGLLYFLGSSTSWTFGIGYYTLYRSVIVGGLAGIVFGDVVTGFFIGALVNVIFLDFSSTGGSLKGDGCLMAIVAVCSYYILKLDAIQSLAVSYFFSLIGIVIWKYRLRVNITFVKKFRKSIGLGKNKIFKYNVFYPQLILMIACFLIISVCIFILSLISKIDIKNINYVLSIFGYVLLFDSLIMQISKLDSLKIILIFFACLIFSFVAFDIALAVYTILILIITLYDYKIISKHKFETKLRISHIQLVKTWSVWMNFCHACYNFEVMQGLGFSYSMKNIIYNLYKSQKNRNIRMLYYSDYFNVEPNIGTPILGYVVAIEEQYSDNINIDGDIQDSIDINSIKKAMMGIMSGLGDSLTQTVITPLFISLSIIFALNGYIAFAIALAIILGVIIIYISYSGFIKGYIIGRNGIIERVNEVKNSFLKKYNVELRVMLLAAIVCGIFYGIQDCVYYSVSSILVSLVISFIIFIIKKLKFKNI